MPPCPAPESLRLLLADRLSETEEQSLSAHVEGCPDCQLRLEQFTRIANRAVVGVGVDPDTEREFRARLQQTPPEGWSLRAPILPDGSATTTPGISRAAGPKRLPSVDGYEIIAELGRGGMGVVYQARHLRLNRRVALKMLLDGPHAGPDQQARFRREAAAAASLQHPHIVQIYEIGEQDGRPYLALEYVAGGSLARHLNGTPQPPRAAAELIQTVAGAVQAAHEAGIVHRDLKPANVLLSFSGEPKATAGDAVASGSPLNECVPKITDFGLAKPVTPSPDERADLTRTGELLGTPSYMAPEQARPHPSVPVGPATDVYALGAILYELLTGRPPFKGATPMDTLLEVLHQEPVPPSRLRLSVPRDLETICLTCLHKDLPRRYAAAADLAADLGRFLAGEPIRARPVRMWERGLKWARRKPALALLIAVSALAVLALIGFSTWYNLELVARNREINRQKVRADANLEQALDVVGRMLPDVRGLPLGDRLEIDPTRRQQLAQAVSFYQALLAEPDNAQPEVRRQVGRAHYHLGQIHFLLGADGPAEQHFREALAVWQELVAEFPTVRAYRQNLADTYRAFGTASADHIEACYQKALDLLETLAHEDPEDLVPQAEQTVIHNNRYQLHAGRNQPAQALAALLRAAELGEALVQRAPDAIGYRITLATSCARLGRHYLLQTGERDKATAALNRSLALLEPHTQAQSRNESFALALVQTYHFLALAAEHAQQHAQRRNWHARSIHTLEAVLRPKPQDRRFRLLLAEAYGGRGVALVNLGQPAEAVPDLDRLVELSDGPEQPRYRYLRAFALARAGQHARAATEAGELAGLAKVSGQYLYDLAMIHVAAVKAVQQEDSRPAAERDRLAEQYGRRAVELLERARQAGFFATPDQRKLLEDEALQPLREREDFRRLAQAVKAATAPGQP